MARSVKKRPRRRPSSGNASGSQPMVTDTPAPAAPPTKVWRPGVDEMNDDEELEYDRDAYDCLHAFHLGWPCLSFDIIRDNLGALREDFPHTLYCVAGTQSDVSARNTVVVAKLSNITGKNRPAVAKNRDDDDDDDSESSDSESEDEDEGLPKLQERSIPHKGCVNRVRGMMQQPHIVAAWSDAGHIQVWDVTPHLNALASGDSSLVTNLQSQVLTGSHKDEGFALDWSPVSEGHLATGDCHRLINIWEPTDGKWIGGTAPLMGHKKSVEDLQWSPNEANVLASCSVDGTIAIWDTRARRQAISVKVHDTDVNVISWSSLTNVLLASGADDGTLRTWDLRKFQDDAFVAHFKYHSSAITSVEWCPHDSTQLAVTSADNQLTIWDLAMERCVEEEKQFQAELGRAQAEVPSDIPPQMLFSHQGQKDMKELHWHPQIPGLIVSTAADGFNVFKASNICANIE